MVSIKLTTTQKIMIIPLLVSLLLIAAVILLIKDVSIVGNVIIISIFICLVPYFAYRYSRFAWIKALERQFPNFIRDLADSKRSGMTLVEAIHIATKTHYGKLTPEIKKMSNRLSWGTPFLRVLDIFSEKTKDSLVISEMINVIKEAYQSGGNITATLDCAARDMTMLEEAEAERKSLASQHVMIIYGIFFLFLGIVIAIIYILVPMMGPSTELIPGAPGLMTFTNPCPEPFPLVPCGVFDSVCLMLGVSKGIGCYYVALFFCVLTIHGMFSGLIAGQLGQNSLVAGMKHSLVMVCSALFVFIFLAKFGLFPG